MAEPDKRQIGDGSDNYGEAARQVARAARESGKMAAEQAAAKGAEAAGNAAAATVQAGVEGGKAVAGVAAGTAVGGPWGAILSAAWSLRHTLFKVLICICLIFLVIIILIVSLPSIVTNSVFGLNGSVVDLENPTTLLESYNDLAADIAVVVEEGYVDTLSKGIRYHKNDVVIEFFRDSACTDKITTWAEDSGKFSLVYDDAQNSMTIRMTEAGLSEINEATTVYTDSVKRGYSDCTMRITYAATLTADAQMGDKDNPNTVTLTWKRTNTTYYDTLEDCCHVYTYGIDVLKQFSDGKGNVQNVKFNLHNDSDDCYIIADLKGGIYYAKSFTSKKSDATTFVPNGSGHIIVKGLEDDTYSLIEVATDKGYILLADAIELVIKTGESGTCEQCATKLLTASATVNGKDVTMTDGNAIVPLTVLNNPGFDLPKTGGRGVWMYTVGGVLLLSAAAFIVVKSRKQHKSEQ